jgi:hypothetical protein
MRHALTSAPMQCRKPKIATFRAWLAAEAADDARRLNKMFSA